MKTCTVCGSRIVTYKGENLCLRCPSESKQVESKQVEINDEPTEILYYIGFRSQYYGCILFAEHWKNKKGEYHREGDKPAVIRYDKNGNIENEEYWVNGTRVK